MKAIELTEEHESKLLEMCQILFPEYDITFSINDGMEEYLHIWRRNPELSEHIYWFEFCLTYLSSRLLEPADMILYQTTGNFMYIHPLEYLYSKFKKL